MKIDSKSRSRPTPPRADVQKPKPTSNAATNATAPSRADRYDAPKTEGAAASTLRTEELNDGSKNCLERALEQATENDDIVLFSDSDGVGHAVVERADGTVVDPNEPSVSWNSVGQYQALNPRYSDPRAIPAEDLQSALAIPPGAARDAALRRLDLFDVANRAVADTGLSAQYSTDGTITLGAKMELEITLASPAEGAIRARVAGGPFNESEVTLSWNPSAPQPDGRYAVSVQFQTKSGYQAEGGWQIGPFGATYGRQAGTYDNTGYTLQMTAADVGRIALGDSPLASIADPLQMSVGSSLMMDTGAFRNGNGSVSVGSLELSSKTAQTEGQSLAVMRTGESTVRVTVGPTEEVQRDVTLGLSLDESLEAKIESGHSVVRSNMATAQFDLATPEGSAAYREFLSSGQLPAAEGEGISDVAQEETVGYQGSLTASVSALKDQFSVSHQFWSEALTYTTRTEDGLTTLTGTGRTDLGDEFTVNWNRNPDGTVALQSTELKLQVPGSDQAVEISLAGTEGIRSMQRVAFEQMQQTFFDEVRRRARIGMYDAPEIVDGSNADVAAFLQQTYPSDHPFQRLAQSPTDEGFSYDGWMRAYEQPTADGPLPAGPGLSSALLHLPDSLDEAVAIELFSGLNGVGDVNNVTDAADSPTYFQLGLQDRPGVRVSGVPPIAFAR